MFINALTFISCTLNPPIIIFSKLLTTNFFLVGLTLSFFAWFNRKFWFFLTGLFLVYFFFKKNLILIEGLQNRIFLAHPLLILIIFWSVWRHKSTILRGCLGKYYLQVNSRIFFLLKLTFFCVIMIFLGGFWAQQEFNWGGWWSWDVVEVSSLFIFFSVFFLTHTSAQTLNVYNINFQNFFLLIFFLIYGLNRFNLFTSIHSFTSAHVCVYVYPLIHVWVWLLVKNWIVFLSNLNANATKSIFYYFYFILLIVYNAYLLDYSNYTVKWLNSFSLCVLLYIYIKIFLNFFKYFFLNILHWVIIISSVYFFIGYNYLYQLIFTTHVTYPPNWYAFGWANLLFYWHQNNIFFIKNGNLFFFKPFNFCWIQFLSLFYNSNYVYSVFSLSTAWVWC